MNIRLTIVTGLAVCTALWANPGTAHGQVIGGNLFSTVNLGGTFNNGASTLYQYTPQYVPPNGTPNIFASGLDTPRGLAFDNTPSPNGPNLFIAINSTTAGTDCNGDNTVSSGSILKINSTSGVMSTFATGFASDWFVQGLATDRYGNVFVTTIQPYDPCDQPFNGQEFPTSIYEVTVDGMVNQIGMLPAAGFGLAFDNAGNLYVVTADGTGGSNSMGGEILEFTPNPDGTWPPNTSPSTFIPPATYPYPGLSPIGLAFDASGNLFVSSIDDAGNGDIREFNSSGTEITYPVPNGGNHFATGLTNAPRGLAFDTAGNLFVAEIGIPGTATTGDILEFTPGGTVFASQNFGTRGNHGPEWLAFATGAVTPPTTAVTLTLPDAPAPLTATVTSIDQNSLPPPPSNFVELSGSNLAFDISTAVTPTPPIIIAFTVSPLLDPSTLRALHYECDTQNPPNCQWQDRTIYPGDPNYPSNPAPNTIYGSVNSLSPFLVARAVPVSLGAASNYTVLALTSANSGRQTVNFSSGTDYGDVAVAGGATLQLQAPSRINGNLYVASGGSVSGPGRVNGTRYTNQNLSVSRTDAINASAQAAAFSPNITFTNVTGNQTVNGVSGVNVVKVTANINLSNASLTLNGPSDAYFIVNVGGSITLGGTGGIVVSGGMPASHLLVNMTGTGSNLLNTHIGNVIQGTLLGSNVGGTLAGSAGAVILGQNFSLMTVTLTHP